jgi:hypothetical protein
MKKNIKTIFIGFMAFFAILIRTCKSELGLLRNETKVLSNVVKEDASISKSIIHEKPTVVNDFKSTDYALNIENATKEESELYKHLKEDLKDELKDRIKQYLKDQYIVRLAVDEIIGDVTKKRMCFKELIDKKLILNSNSEKDFRLLLLGNLFNQKKLDDEFRTDLFFYYSDKFFCYTLSNLVNQDKLAINDLKLIVEISNIRQIKDDKFLKLIQTKISELN